MMFTASTETTALTPGGTKTGAGGREQEKMQQFTQELKLYILIHYFLY